MRSCSRTCYFKQFRCLFVREVQNISAKHDFRSNFMIRSQKYSGSSHHCVESVRKYDYENFLCALLLPLEARTTAFAIRAFNIEISQITDHVSQRELAMARLIFWKQFINQIHAEIENQTPITLELSRAIRKHDLPKHWLRKMIEAREKYFGDKPFLSCQDVEEYGERTNSSVYYLILKSLGLNSVECDHVASHVGKAQSISNLIRGVPHNASNQRVALPLDILAQNDVSQEDFIRGRQDMATENVFFCLADLANKHVETAKSLSKNIPLKARRCFLPLVAVSSYLQRLQRENFNVFSPKLQHRDNLLPMSLYWHRLRGKF